MKSIGVDLHKDSMTIVVLDEKGEVVDKTRIATKCRNKIVAYFSSYGLQCQVAVESVGFYYWFWELVRPLVKKLCLADPAGVRAFAGRKAKTDRNDALLLAQLLRDGRLPTAYVPEEPVRSLRELVRLRHSIARSLAAARKSLRWVSLKTNLPGPAVLTSERAQKWLLAQDNKFSEAVRTAGRFQFDRIVKYERDLGDIERIILKRIKDIPELHSVYDLIKTVPGVGPITAATVITETGDITRFNSIDEISAYAGLCPKVSQSGETVHHGHISKMGPPLLRWVMQQAAWVAIRTDENIRKIFNRIARKAGKKKAATAVARKTLSYCWSVSRRKSHFQWPDKNNKENKKVKSDHIKEVWCYQI